MTLDEGTRIALAAIGMILSAIGLALIVWMMPRYVETQRRPHRVAWYARLQESVGERTFETINLVAGIGLVILVLGGLLVFQARLGITPQPLQAIQDGRSAGFATVFLTIVLTITLLLGRRRGIASEGEVAARLRTELNGWLARAAPGLQDAGARLHTVVYVGEAKEWSLVLVDDTPSNRPQLFLRAICSAAAPPQEMKALSWFHQENGHENVAQPRWNWMLTQAGQHEASLEISPSKVVGEAFRHQFEARKLFGLDLRAALLTALSVTAAGVALELAAWLA